MSWFKDCKGCEEEFKKTGIETGKGRYCFSCLLNNHFCSLCDAGFDGDDESFDEHERCFKCNSEFCKTCYVQGVCLICFAVSLRKSNKKKRRNV